MERFLFLFRDSNPVENTDTAFMEKWTRWADTLAKQGIFEGGEPLDRNGKLISGKKKVVTDGPFIEAKDIVGGYFIVKALGIDEAVMIAKDCPIYELDGNVEVRRLLTM
jgi:hypothetical protein